LACAVPFVRSKMSNLPYPVNPAQHQVHDADGRPTYPGSYEPQVAAAYPPQCPQPGYPAAPAYPQPSPTPGYQPQAGSGPGYPPLGSGYPTQESGYPPQGSGYPPQDSGYPPPSNQGSGYPPQAPGYSAQGPGYPPGPAYLAQANQPGPASASTYPQQGSGYPPQQQQQPSFNPNASDAASPNSNSPYPPAGSGGNNVYPNLPSSDSRSGSGLPYPQIPCGGGNEGRYPVGAGGDGQINANYVEPNAGGKKLLMGKIQGIQGMLPGGVNKIFDKGRKINEGLLEQLAQNPVVFVVARNPVLKCI
jgi:hypothetical protein